MARARRPITLAALEAWSLRNGYAHTIPLLWASWFRRVFHVMLDRTDATAPFRLIDRWGLPAVLSIPDDDDIPTGPDGWPCTLSLLGWPDAILLRAGPGGAWLYSMAVGLALERGRTLIIETTTDHVAAWCAWISRAPQCPEVLTVLPPAGCVHPAWRGLTAVH